LPQLDREYIQTGKVKYVFRHFPLSSHKQAFKAAEAANCAGEQGKFWQMHARLFENQGALSVEDLSRYAQSLDLDWPKFQQCLEGGKYAAAIRQDIEEGQKAGVSGTPTFFLGLTEPGGSKVKVLKVIRGAQAYATFKQAIDSVLSSQKP
jgi:protein-disulfide isomerase